MKIILFNDVWYDCFNTMLNHIIYSIDNNRVDLIYNNTYEYAVTEEKLNSGKAYYSFQTFSTNQENLANSYLYDRRGENFSDKKELINEIIKLLVNERIVIANVDMFYFLTEYSNIYHVNHIPHVAFIHDYNKENDTFSILEEKEYSIATDNLAEACIRANGYIASAKINESANLPLVTSQAIINQSKQIIHSIDQTVLNRDDFWLIDSPSRQDIDYFQSIAATHLNNIKNRNYANGWLYEHIVYPGCVENPFHNIETKISILRRTIMKNCQKYNWENISEIKGQVLALIKQERDVWTSL